MYRSTRPCQRPGARARAAASPAGEVWIHLFWLTILAAILLTLAGPAGAQLPAAGAPAGELLVSGAGEIWGEAFELPSATAAALRAARGTVTLEAFPVAPGFRARVELERFAVYAPDARVFVLDADGRREAPRSRRLHFLGTSPDDRRIRVALSVDPDTGTLRGLAAGPVGLYELAEPSGDDPARHRVQRSRSDLEPLLSTECGSDRLPIPASVYERMDRAPLSRAGKAAEPLRQATVAVDTDNELNHLKFGNDTAAATDWIADLFTEMNVLYERDVSLRLLQGDTFLRRDLDSPPTYDDDPWQVGGSGASGEQLDEFGGFWQGNMGSVDRVLAMLLSGKAGSDYSASGIAWLDGYCEYQSWGGGYSVSQVFKANLPVSYDVGLVAHEIGHNLGSRHTHCYNPPVDECYAGEGGCFSGATSCPPEGYGTLMSYCHLRSGCGSANELHPTVAALVDSYMAAHTPGCIEELAAEGSIFADGFESGDTSAWGS